MNPEKIKKRLVFEKTHRMRFVGHLDMMRIFQRAISREGIELAYSQGFNPHPRMSFARPLSLGQTSHVEIMELELAKDIPNEELVRSVNSALPVHLQILACYDMPESAKPAMSLVTHAEYKITLPETYRDEYAEDLAHFLEMPSITIQKLAKFKGRKQMVDLDIKPMLCSLELTDPCTLKLLCLSTEKENLKPDRMMKVFWESCGHPEEVGYELIERTGLYCQQEDGRLVDLISIMKDH